MRNENTIWFARNDRESRVRILRKQLMRSDQRGKGRVLFAAGGKRGRQSYRDCTSQLQQASASWTLTTICESTTSTI